MNRKKRIYQILNLYRLIPAWIVLNVQPAEKKKIIYEELNLWHKCTKSNCSGCFDTFSELLLMLKEYRSLLVYRLRGVSSYFMRFLFPPMETLQINTKNIGPRLYIQHGSGTIISAKSIGSDCWINQDVTIGYGYSPNPPIIGNGVRIAAGAKVIGDIHIGDNAVIAANAAVVKDVPENAVVGGVPAKIIGENILYKRFVEKKTTCNK